MTTIMTSEPLAECILRALGLDPAIAATCEGVDIQLRPKEPIRVSVLLLAGDNLITVPWHALLTEAIQ